jgi:hypothetical protein
MPGAALAADSREPVGHAVSVRGNVFAQSPGEERRALQCRDPLYDGDTIFTLDQSDVGIDAGDTHVRLGESSQAEIGRLASDPGGAPRLDLVQGHLRLIDTDAGQGASAELTTPGLRVARTGPDQDALVLSEKAGTVSMVCAYDEPVEVERRFDPSTRLVAEPGGCVVGKPRESLYAADATHPPLAVLLRDACSELASTPVSDRFSPAAVGLGPPATGGEGAGLPVAVAFGAGAGLPVLLPPVVPLPTQFPSVPPVLPPAPAPVP